MTAEVTQLITIEAAEHVGESPFYIPMTGPATRQRRSLKHDDTFIVLDSHGDIGASAGGPDGLFNADTRYLARLEMVLDEVQPLLLGSNLRDDNAVLRIDLTNPDIFVDGELRLAKDTFHVARAKFLWQASCYELFTVTSYAGEPTRLRLALDFAAVFAAIFFFPSLISLLVDWWWFQEIGYQVVFTRELVTRVLLFLAVQRWRGDEHRRAFSAIEPESNLPEWVHDAFAAGAPRGHEVRDRRGTQNASDRTSAGER